MPDAPAGAAAAKKAGRATRKTPPQAQKRRNENDLGGLGAAIGWGRDRAAGGKKKGGRRAGRAGTREKKTHTIPTPSPLFYIFRLVNCLGLCRAEPCRAEHIGTRINKCHAGIRVSYDFTDFFKVMVFLHKMYSV